MMALKIAADRQTAREAAAGDVAIIAAILTALSAQAGDPIEGAVVHWLGQRLDAAAQVLEDQP